MKEYSCVAKCVVNANMLFPCFYSQLMVFGAILLVSCEMFKENFKAGKQILSE